MRAANGWRSGSRFGWLLGGLWVAVLTAVLAPVALAQSPGLEPPERPQGLRAEVSHDTVSLSWDDPGDATISGYQILRRDRDRSPVGVFEVLVEDSGSAAAAYADRQVQPETRYNYRVKARNAAGLSRRSNFVRADTPAAPEEALKKAIEGLPEEAVTVWTGQLTVGVFAAAAPPVAGYAVWTRQGALSPDSFWFDKKEYTVLGLLEHGGGLNLVLGQPLPHDFVLELGARRYESGASLEPVFVWAGRYWWPDDAIGWAAGDELTVSIVLDPSTTASERALAPPSAYLTEAPAAHNGRDPFRVKLVFDESALPLTAALLRDHALQVSGGSVVAVTQGRRSDWLITLQPDGDGPLTVSLPSPADCDDAGAVCSADGRKLRGRLTATIAGPPQLAALQIVGATLSPAFDPASELFTAETALEQVTVEAAADRPSAQLTISPPDADPQQAGHQVALAAAGETTIELELQSLTGEPARVYWVVLRRSAAATEAPSSGLNALRFSGLPALEFSEHESRFELDAPEDLEETTVIVSRAESEAGVDVFTVRGDELVVDDADHDPGAPGHQVRLSGWGDTLLLVRVTSGDGRSQRAYVTHLRGEPNSPPATPGLRSGPRSAPKLNSNGARDDVPTTLSALSLSGADLTPAFASDVFQYEANAAADLTQVTVTATPTASDATLRVIPADADPMLAGHQVDLGAAETVIAVIVSNPAGQLNSYLLTVLRELPATPTSLQSLVEPVASITRTSLFALAVTGHTGNLRTTKNYRLELRPDFQPDIFSYQVAAPAEITHVAISPTRWFFDTNIIEEPNGSAIWMDKSYSIGPPGSEIATTYNLIVRSPGADPSTYSITVTRPALEQTDASLYELNVQHRRLIPRFEPETYEYRLTVPDHRDTLNVDITSSNSNASISVSPADADPQEPGYQIPLVPAQPGGDPALTTVTITVTSEDLSATRTYTLTVTRRTPGPALVTVEFPEHCSLRELEDAPIIDTWYFLTIGEQTCYRSGLNISRMYRMVVLKRSEINIELITARERFLQVLDTGGVRGPRSYKYADEINPVEQNVSYTLDAGTYIIRFDQTGWFSAHNGRFYTLNVTGDHVLRPSSRLLRDLQLDGVSLPAFDSYLLSYDIARPANNATMTTVTATPQAPATAADITLLPADADLNTAGHQVEIPIDRDTLISVRIADSGGRVAPLTYTVTVPLDAEAAPTGLAASSSVDGVELEWISPVKNASAVTGYAIWRRSLDAGETELTLLTADTGNADVAYLDQTTTVTGDRFEYQVVALRVSVVSAGSNLALIKYEDPSDSSLQSLSVQRALVTGFSADTSTYAVTLPAGTSTFQVDALPSSSRATISASPAPAHSSQGGFWYELPSSPDDGADAQIAVVITVTSEDKSSSTTYTITVTRATGPATGGFKFIEVGWTFACAIRLDGTSACWNYEVPRHADHAGWNSYGYPIVDNQPQGGVVQELTAAIARACALRPDGETHCWGTLGDPINTPSIGGQGTLTQQSGTGPLIHFFTFGTGVKLLSDGSVVDLKSGRLPSSLAAGPYQAVGTAGEFTCALDLNGHIKCWESGRSLRIPYPDVEFKYLGVGGFTTCGIRKDDSTLHCWEWISNGRRYVLHENEPEDKFRMVDAGYGAILCGVTVAGKAQCWAGWNENQGRDRFWGYTTERYAANLANLVVAPDLDTHSYTMVAMDRQSFACGLRTDSSIACWGWDNEYLASLLPPFESPWHDSAELIALTVDNGVLLPEFDRDVTAYELSVDNATTAISVTPEVTNLFASYAISADTDAEIDGVVDLSVGANVVTITVTAADGVTTRDYTVTVTRAAAN